MTELLNMTVGQMLDRCALEHPDNDAVVYPHEGIRWTYKEFKDICEVAARGFMSIGIKKGDNVAMWATNYPQWIITMFATAKIGATLVTVNTNYKQYELEYLMRQSDSSTLILMEGFKDSKYIDHINGLCENLKTSKPGELNSTKLPFLKNVIYLSENGERYDGMFNWDDIMALGEKVPIEKLREVEATLDPKDVINMQYTSGTTGFPKGVMLTHHNITNNGSSIADCMKFTYEDKLLITVPFFHCFGCVLAVMACVSKATTMVIVKQFNPVKVMEAIDMERCSAVHGVPTMFIAMLEHESFKKYDFSCLRTGIMAGSLCPVEIMRRAMDEMHLPEITIAFGQTESSPVITQTKTDDPLEVRVTTVGKKMPHMEVKIVDLDTGEDLPAGQQGEIVTRGYQVMKGYYKMEEATKKAIDAQGWLHTGDIGVVDENGYFKVTGRLKDMIIRGGENIYPREIEEYIYTYNGVRDVQVVGVPDKKYGEEVMAFVILKEGETATEEQIINFVKSGLSRYKAPRYVRFVDAFPMTASGKIQKFKLREMIINERELADVETVEIKN